MAKKRERLEDTPEFMKKYGRSGVPFYVLFSPKLANGMVLPEILTEKDFLYLTKKDEGNAGNY